MTLIIVLIQAIQTAFFDYLKWQKLQIPGLMDKSVNVMFLFYDKVMHICVFMQVFQA